MGRVTILLRISQKSFQCGKCSKRENSLMRMNVVLMALNVPTDEARDNFLKTDVVTPTLHCE